MCDYIERDAAIACVLEQLPMGGLMDTVEGVLMDLPSADVQPVVRGRWELTHRIEGAGEIGCSVCGWATFGRLNADGSYRLYKFCPGCGAEMHEGLKEGNETA